MELIDWMKEHGVADALRVYATNELEDGQKYEPFKDLMVKGEAVVKITLHERQPHMHVVTVEAVETTTPTQLETPIETKEQTTPLTTQRLRKLARRKKD